MANISLFLVASAVVLSGWNFGAHWWKVKNAITPARNDRAGIERQMKSQGVMDEEGSIHADTEFDADLNLLLHDLNGAESSTAKELSGLEAQE